MPSDPPINRLPVELQAPADPRVWNLPTLYETLHGFRRAAEIGRALSHGDVAAYRGRVHARPPSAAHSAHTDFGKQSTQPAAPQ